jgi:predicted permease
VFTTNQVFLEVLVPVFFGLGLGYYAGRRGRVDNKNVHALNVTLMHFILPCSLFLGVARTPPALLRSQSSLLLVLGLYMVMVYAMAFFLERKPLGKSTRESSVQALTVAFSNNVAIGLPLLVGLYADAGLLAVTAGILAGALIISPITLVLLEWTAGNSEAGPHSLAARLGPALLASLRRPVILAPLCALIVPLTGYTLPLAAVHTLDLTGKATVGVALFLTGLILSAHPLRLSASVVCGVLLKNFGQPAVAFALILLLHQHGIVAREAFLMAAVPAGFFGTVFGARYGVNSRDTSSTLVLSTVASIVTIPLAIHLSVYLP